VAAPLPPVPLGIRLTRATAPLVVVEMFHDVCCPYSNRMFTTVGTRVIPELERLGLHDRVGFVFQSVPQPWHPQSCAMHDAVMAAVILDPRSAPTFIANIFARQTEYFDDTTKDLSRNQIYDGLAKIAGASGYDAAALRQLLSLAGVRGNDGLGEVTQRLKWAVRYHRVRAVHTTPTVFVNGIEAAEVSSGWSSEQWLDLLRPLADALVLRRRPRPNDGPLRPLPG